MVIPRESLVTGQVKYEWVPLTATMALQSYTKKKYYKSQKAFVCVCLRFSRIIQNLERVDCFSLTYLSIFGRERHKKLIGPIFGKILVILECNSPAIKLLCSKGFGSDCWINAVQHAHIQHSITTTTSTTHSSASYLYICVVLKHFQQNNSCCWLFFLHSSYNSRGAVAGIWIFWLTLNPHQWQN